MWQESLLVSSDVSQKGALHSSSTASNLGTHVRAHGVDDLMVVSIINIWLLNSLSDMRILTMTLFLTI